MIVTVGCVLIYFAIGLSIGKFSDGRFDIATMCLWPVGLDIRIESWFELRRIDREGKLKIAEAIKERDSKLRLIDVRWVGAKDEVVIIMAYGEEIEAWRGSGTEWERPRDGERGSDWMREWLCAQWTVAKRHLDEMAT